jgi:hypothetical protein
MPRTASRQPSEPAWGAMMPPVRLAHEDREIDLPEHRHVVGAVPQANRPDRPPPGFVERSQGPDGAALVASADKVMEPASPDDVEAPGLGLLDDPEKLAFVSQDERLVIFA